jgi:plasmid stability protein
MATLYVENVPEDLYEALRKRAREEQRSMAAEVIRLLEANLPTEKELERRRKAFQKIDRLKFTSSQNAEPLPSSLEMIREDRDR